MGVLRAVLCFAVLNGGFACRGVVCCVEWGQCLVLRAVGYCAVWKREAAETAPERKTRGEPREGTPTPTKPPRPPRPRTRRRRPRRRSLIRGRSTIPPLCCRLRRRPRPQPRLPHRLPRRRRLPTQLRAQWRDQLRDNLYHKYNSTPQFADACKSSRAQR